MGSCCINPSDVSQDQALNINILLILGQLPDDGGNPHYLRGSFVPEALFAQGFAFHRRLPNWFLHFVILSGLKIC